jgi:ubiquinol-cytochrome c reductase cytochrome b subunit
VRDLDRVPLTAPQDSILIGTLLGDGAMRCKTNALLEVNHSIRQRGYVDWKYRMLSDLVATPPSQRGGAGGRVAYRFVTRSLPVLTPYYRAFYPFGRKVVPDVRLTPLALAVWLMDDGSRSRTSIYLNTQQFSTDDQIKLLALLDREFAIKGTLNRDRTYYRIRIAVSSVPSFRELTAQHILPEFAYKLPSE